MADLLLMDMKSLLFPAKLLFASHVVISRKNCFHKFCGYFLNFFSHKESNDVETLNEFYGSTKINYTFAPKHYVFGQLIYDTDKFRTDETRTSLTAGYGYKLLRTERFKASNEISLAFLKSDSNEMIVRNSLWVTYKFSPNLNLTNKLLYESGNDMYLRNSTDLMYKLTDKISIGVGNTYTDNIETRNVFTINLAIKFK